MIVIIHDPCRRKRKRKRRMVPLIGPITEQTLLAAAASGSSNNQRRHTSIGEILAMVNISSSQQVKLGVRFLDKRGNEAQVDGTPEWSTDNPDALTITPADDGLSCVVAAAGPLTNGAMVTMTADADLGDGVEPLIGSIEINVTAGQATQVEITAETPEEQPE